MQARATERNRRKHALQKKAHTESHTYSTQARMHTHQHKHAQQRGTSANTDTHTHTVDSFRSLVVPAIGVTIALFRVANRLYSVDLPTFGLPTITTRNAPPCAGALSGGCFTNACRKPSPSPAGLPLFRAAVLLFRHRGLPTPPPPPARGCVLSARVCRVGYRAIGGVDVGVVVVVGIWWRNVEVEGVGIASVEIGGDYSSAVVQHQRLPTFNPLAVWPACFCSRHAPTALLMFVVVFA